MAELISRKQLDKAGKRFRKFEEGPSDVELLQTYRDFRAIEMPQVFRELAKGLDGMSALLSARAKRTDTIVRKLRRESTMQLTTMADIIGFRIVVDCLETQRRVVDKLCESGTILKVQDYLLSPKNSGYRGVHIIMPIKQKLPKSSDQSKFTYEVQIRTVYQHLWSTESESYGEQVKEGGGSLSVRDYLTELGARIRLIEDGQPDFTQRHDLKSAQEITFYSMVFDKKLGRVVSEVAHGKDLEGAIAYFSYLEKMHSANFGKEVVLLAAPSSVDELNVTHMRYFQFQGRPFIPKAIAAGLQRPSGD